MVRVFVYGTLRKGMYNHDIYLRERSVYCGDGYIKGSLMTIAGVVYPAFLPQGDHLVFGELYDVDEETVQCLDELESYFGEHNQDNEYNKISMDILNQDGQVKDQAYVYIYNMDNPRNVESLGDDIEESDYVLYMQKQKLRNQSVFDDQENVL